MNARASFFAVAGLCVLTTAPAQGEVLELGEVVVSAGRTPVESGKVGRAHTIVTGKALEASQTRYVADALRKVPGLAVSRTGSFGGLTQIRIRGSEANHVLVLIDGVEVASTSSGEFDFGSLHVADIDRIEVLRGPQSALYGSNATSGVIHIITKGGKRDGYEITARSEVGTDRTLLGTVGLRGGAEHVDVALSAAYRRTDGFNVSDLGSEDDGDRNVTLNAKVNWDITGNLKFDSTFRLVDRKSEIDDFDFSGGPNQGLVVDAVRANNETHEFYTGNGLTLSLLDGSLIQKARFNYTDVNRRGQNGAGAMNGSDDTRIHLGYQTTYYFDTPDFLSAKHSITGAVEWERETYRNAFPSDPSQRPTQERSFYGFVGEYRGEFSDNVFFSAALRHDVNEDFDDATTYSLSAAYLLPGSGTRLHASLAKGVTNPTFFEQFGFVPGRFIGNPNLTPEVNFGWDIGVEQKFWDDRITLDVTYFNERLEDEIRAMATRPVNLDGTSKRQGVEVALAFELFENLHTTATYTYLDATEPSGEEEVRRPHHSGAVNVTYTFNDGRGRVFADAIYNGEMTDFSYINYFTNGFLPERVTLDDYVVVNVGADYQVTDHMNLFARVENVFDTDYEEVFGYNTQGITAFAGIKGTY